MFLVGAGVFASAPTSMQETEGLVFLLISAVFFVGASVIDAIVSARKKFEVLFQGNSTSAHIAPPLAPTQSPKPAAAATVTRPYFFSVDGRDSGPHSLDEMRSLRKSGKIGDDTMVIRQGDANWQAASMFSEICF